MGLNIQGIHKFKDYIEGREDKKSVYAMPLEDMVTAIQTALEVLYHEFVK